MAILVTGGAGYIGSHMVLALVDAGEDVVVLDDLSTGVRGAVSPRARLVVGDVADTPLVRRVIADHEVEEIIHFAAKIVVPDSVADPLGYYLSNTVKSRALLAAATEARVPRFVFSSTAAVYGMPKENPVGEDAPDPADLALRLLEADDRMDAARYGRRQRFRIRRASLFQRRRSRSRRTRGPVLAYGDAPDQGRGRTRARQAHANGRLRHRLSELRMAPASAITST